MNLTSTRHAARARLGMVLLIFASAGSLVATAANSGGAGAPATVAKAVSEAELVQLTLTPEAVKRLGIETATVQQRSVAATVTYGGEVMAGSGQRMIVTAPVAGLVAAPSGLAFPLAGQQLQAGAGVLRLTPLPATADLLALDETAALRRAQLARTEKLLAAGGASQEELEQARVELARAEAAMHVAGAASGQTGAAGASAITLSSPSSAEIHALHVAPGQLVAAGAPLFELVGGGALWVRVPVYPGAVANIDARAAAEVAPLSAWGSGEGRSARRIAGPATADAASSSADLYYTLDGAARVGLRVGERVRVRLPLAGASSALTVPQGAIWHDINGGAWVYVQSAAGKYARQRVELERVTGGVAVLRRGPAIGTTVVTVGVAELAGTEFGVDH